MTEFIDAQAFQSMVICAHAALNASKQHLNELNVFPVPDGDTGTNMTMTMTNAVTELKKKNPQTLGAAADCVASGLLRGARGNSGVILSLLFRGIAKKLKGVEKADAVLFAAAMQEGVDAAYKAVMKPAEGTILTVSRLATAAAVEFAANGADVELMLTCALEAGREALADTVNLNPVLKKAGVVDAGGQGYIIIWQAMLECLQGRFVMPEEVEETVKEKADFAAIDDEEITFTFDTVFIVRKTVDKPLDGLRAYLSSIGDCLVIGEDDEAFKVHVHTDIPGSALTEAQKYGTLEVAKIENMRIQHEDVAAGRKAISADDLDDESEMPHGNAGPAAPEKELGVVAVCAGDGLASLFKELGADAVVTGGQTMNPSTQDILAAVDSTPANTVFVFPNNKNIIMAAQQCAPLTEKQVVVIPTGAVPQGISAMINYDPSATAEDMEAVFNESIGTVHTAQVTYAARDSEFDGHHILAGQYLALLDGALVGSFDAFPALLEALNKKIAALDPSLISVYYGEDIQEADAEETAGIIGAAFPDAEVMTVNGGQPVYYYMISIE